MVLRGHLKRRLYLCLCSFFSIRVTTVDPETVRLFQQLLVHTSWDRALSRAGLRQGHLGVMIWAEDTCCSALPGCMGESMSGPQVQQLACLHTTCKGLPPAAGDSCVPRPFWGCRSQKHHFRAGLTIPGRCLNSHSSLPLPFHFLQVSGFLWPLCLLLF